MSPQPDREPDDPALARYSRQTMFPPLGVEGQRRLLTSRALVVGCGALGTVIANTLARAGVGHLRIVDRDFVELNNLQRQVLFDEADAAAALPKAIVAADKLRRANSQIEIEPIVADVDHVNIQSLCDGVQVILDATDNFEIRFLINDAALKWNIPWVYGGCLGAEGQTMTIVPGETPCLRCLMSESPPPGTTPTCDTAGILASIIGVIASMEALEALKILSGQRSAVSRTLNIVELWDNRLRQVNVAGLRESVDCPSCQGRDFPWLEGRRGSQSAVLCGRNAVQLSHLGAQRLSLDAVVQKWTGLGQVMRNAYLARLTVDGYVVTLFPDGRAIVGGTDDVATARTVYARYVGN